MEISKDFKAGYAAIIGRPNVGKSTLMNCLIGQKIAITRTVYTSDEGQIVFLDTPGIHKARNRLGEYMIKTVNFVLKDVDVVLWLVEASEYIGPSDRQIAEKLREIDLPVILVINKIDTVERDDLFKIIDVYRGLCDFAEVVPVSALKADNVDTLTEQIFKYLPYGMPFFDEDTVTDQPERQITAELIREKALRCLDEEVPHGIAVTIERMKEEKDIVHIDATVICERESHKGIIIGKQGQMLKKIGQAARYEIERMLDKKVNLKLWVKVRNDWRDSDILLKNFGYDGKEFLE